MRFRKQRFKEKESNRNLRKLCAVKSQPIGFSSPMPESMARHRGRFLWSFRNLGEQVIARHGGHYIPAVLAWFQARCRDEYAADGFSRVAYLTERFNAAYNLRVL